MTEKKHKVDISISEPIILTQLFGKLDENINIIENKYDVKIKLHDGFLTVTGEKQENIESADKILSTILKILKTQKSIGIRDIEYIIEQSEKNPDLDLSNPYNQAIVFSSTGKVIRPKTLGQKRYVDGIIENDITFGIGPAGTGKTYLAVAMAVKAFKEKEVSRIILTRPAVEAGENLGFLPGDLQMKVDPYLRPLYDSLFDMLGADTFRDLVEKNVIEVAPLAYMRGRTLDNAYIILDEAQNTTNEQMKMFLTRLGHGSKAIINGDITQIDLKKGQSSGLVDVITILKGIKGIEFVYLDRSDVVRHKVVQRIIDAYESLDKNRR